MIVGNITELIGNTPLVKLNNIVPKGYADVYVKLENLNPSGSVKDRAALSMIKDAEDRGIIKPGATIIEPTSGNTGIGIAMVAAAQGYKSIIIMPDTATQERINLLRMYGARVILTPGEELITGCIKRAEELLKEIHNSFMPNQFENMSNPKIHENTTAVEILKDLEYNLDAFVATAGTGGTISGTGKTLRKEIPNLKIYVVEAKASPVIAGGVVGKHKIIGTGPGFIPKTLDMNIFNKILHVTDEEAIKTTKGLAQMEGILGGISAGAATFSAIKIAKELGTGKRVVAMIPDTGERYLSMNLV